MAHNAFIHGGTASPLAWLPGYVPSQLDWQTLDQRQFEAINGDLGGTWAPSSVITVGGSGLTTSGPFTASGTVAINGAMTVSTNAVFQAGNTFWNVQTIDGAHTGELKFTSGALLTGLAGATATWASAFTHNGTTTCNALLTATSGFQVTAGTVALSSQINVGANLKILSGSGSLTIEASTTVSVATPITLASGGALLLRSVVGPDANTTYSANTTDLISIGTITADRDYTLNDAANGTWIHISMANATGSGTKKVNIKRQDATAICTLWWQQLGLTDAFWLVVRGGSWQIHDAKTYGT